MILNTLKLQKISLFTKFITTYNSSNSRYLEENYYLIDFKRVLDSKIELKKMSSKNYNVQTDRIYPKEYFVYGYNCFYELMLSESIVDLVNNNFKTVEQRRFEKQLMDATDKYNSTIRWTRASFFVALGAALAAFIIPFLISTKIDRSQIDEIIFEIRDKKAIPELIELKQCNSIVKENRINKDSIIIK